MKLPDDFRVDSVLTCDASEIKDLMRHTLREYYMGKIDFKPIVDAIFRVSQELPVSLEDMKDILCWLDIVSFTVDVEDYESSRWGGRSPSALFESLRENLMRKILYSYNLASDLTDEYNRPLVYPVMRYDVELFDGTIVEFVADLSGKTIQNMHVLDSNLEDRWRLTNLRAKESTSASDNFNSGCKKCDTK